VGGGSIAPSLWVRGLTLRLKGQTYEIVNTLQRLLGREVDFFLILKG
jgi:hypothetical protein